MSFFDEQERNTIVSFCDDVDVIFIKPVGNMNPTPRRRGS